MIYVDDVVQTEQGLGIITEIEEEGYRVRGIDDDWEEELTEVEKVKLADLKVDIVVSEDVKKLEEFKNKGEMKCLLIYYNEDGEEI